AAGLTSLSNWAHSAPASLATGTGGFLFPHATSIATAKRIPETKLATDFTDFADFNPLSPRNPRLNPVPLRRNIGLCTLALIRDDHSALDGELRSQKVPIAFERVAVKHDDIRQLAGFQCAELIAHLDVGCRVRSHE